jgi:hypothetical protein
MTHKLGLALAFLLVICSLCALPADAARTRTVQPGDRVSGELERSDEQLEDDCYYDTYVIDAPTGTMVKITETSDEIDPYLIVISPDEMQWENDDRTSDDLNSELQVLIKDSGEYQIICSSYAQQTGGYELRIEEIEPPRYLGVFVGIQDYPEDYPEAPMCDEDAQALYDTFVDEGFMNPDDGIVLKNEDATSENLQDAFDQMADEVGPDDVFVFFFSGHGTQLEASENRNNHELDQLDEAICLMDTDFSDNDFAALLDEVNAKLDVVVLDACNSGGFAQDVVNRADRVLFASSEEDVLSDFAPQLEAGGYLAAFFRDAITGEADLDNDGVIMMGELASYLEQRYNEEIPNPDVATYGYQQLVHDRGLVPQTEIFCWFGARDDIDDREHDK